MKAMDVSMNISTESDDCMIETANPMKTKKMKQARLSFQTLSASKSPNSTNNMSKKRKIMSPVEEENKSSKAIKYTKGFSKDISDSKENSEEEFSNSGDDIKIILDKEMKDSEDYEKKKKVDITPKRNTQGKGKKRDKAQEKSGFLTKFLKKTNEETVSDVSPNNNELEDKRDCQNISVYKEDDCKKNSDIQLIESVSQHVSEINEKLEDANIASKDTEDYSICEKLDCDVTILSLDNEANDLDKSVSEEKISKSETSTTMENDTNAKKKFKKLSMKQLEKKQEIARKKEEKTRLKMEREKKREEEKANQRRKKEEKQREKEEKERIEKEQKRKEKELKELKKQMEIEQKQKEKEAKEEERRKREEAKEEEKRKKEEERLEAERKKQKAASNFASFFVPKKQEVKSTEEESVVEMKNFMPFEVKADMRIAPVCRRTLNKDEKSLLDEKCNAENATISELYLEDLKKQTVIPRTSSKTWPFETKDDDIILLGEDNDESSNIIRETHNLENHRPKLLQFGDNRRPPYWGTWRKRSDVIKSRQPFAIDKKWFDYEVDSDDEWEEEEPGESLKGSDDEKDEENPEENEYDVDNEFMVPHGYLSDEEAQADDEEMEDMSPQTQKMKLKLLGEQFEAERNVKTHKLKPRTIGCIWQERDNSFPKSTPVKVEEFLSARQAWVNHVPIILPSSENDAATNTECKTLTQQQSGRSTKKKTKFPDEALPDLIRLVHGNTHGRRFLLKEFIAFWSKSDKASGQQLSKISVSQKIKEVANWKACPEEGPMHLKSCWYVAEDIRKQYLPNDLTLPNRWTYILTPSRKSVMQDVADKDKTEKEEREKEKDKRHAPLITQFTKKIAQDEVKKQLEVKPDQAIASKLPPPLQRPPKRVTLISVGRGEQFPEKSRENMLAKFVGLNKKKEEPSRTEKIDVDSDVMFVESVNKDAKMNQ